MLDQNNYEMSLQLLNSTESDTFEEIVKNYQQAILVLEAETFMPKASEEERNKVKE